MPGIYYGSSESYTSHNDGEVPPVSLHIAQVCAVSDVFTYQSQQYGEKKAIRIEWQLPNAFDSKGRPFIVNKKYNVTLNDKGQIKLDTRTDTKHSLSKDLQAWKPVIASDLNDLIGQMCQLLIMHKPKNNGGVFANVAQILPLPNTNANGGINANNKPADDLPF